MAEHAEDTAQQETGSEEPDQESRGRRRRKREIDTTKLREQAVGLLASVIRWAGLLFAVILVAHVVLVIGEANPDNWITGTVADLADGLAIGFKSLFIMDDAKLQVLVNYGIAALFWLVVTAIAARIVRRLGGATV